VNRIMNRISKVQTYFNVARDIAKRGTCLRRNFGAVIVKNDRIVSTGYTGSVRGSDHCCDRGICRREELEVPAGERYELCRSLHAEMNAIIQATMEEMEKASLFLVGVSQQTHDTLYDYEPCLLCKRMIINAGISLVYIESFIDGYREIEVKGWVSIL